MSPTRAALVLVGALLLGGCYDFSRYHAAADTRRLGEPTSDPDVQLLTPRSAFAALRVGDSVCVFGGDHYATTAVSGVASFDGIECAAIRSDSALAPFSAQPGRLSVPRSHAAVATSGLFVYLVGGLDATDTLLASVDRMEIGSDGSPGPFELEAMPLLKARTGAQAIVLDSVLYVIGGDTPLGYVDRVEAATIDASGHLGPFHAVTGVVGPMVKWSQLARVGSSLHAIGGYDGTDEIPTVFRAPGFPAAPGFAPLGAGMTAHRDSHAALVLNEVLYVLGGDTRGHALDTIESAEVTGDALGPFQAQPSRLTEPRQNFGAVRVDDRIYLIGGVDLDKRMQLSSVEHLTLR